MKFLRFASFLFATLLVLLAGKDACAQWKNVAPNIVSPNSNLGFGYGGMTYKDGKIIAISYGAPMCMSSDTGKTWQLAAPPYGADELFDVDQFDRNNVILTTYGSGLYKTTDGGTTWIATSFPSNLRSARFLQSANEIVVGEYYGSIDISHDGGVTWQRSLTTSQNSTRTRKKDNAIFVLQIAAGGGTPGRIYASPDGGNTWSQSAGSFYSDCSGMSLDPCNDNTIYVVNEATVFNNDGFGHIFRSTDNGLSFQSVYTQNTNYFCGSIIAAPGGTLYAQTQQQGIIRSTDHGSTWKSIGGPNGNNDNNAICCVNDNIVVAFSSTGSIWATFNSGGDSVIGDVQNIPAFVIKTTDQKTDTIGGSVAVPILLKGLSDTEDVDIVIHYDPILSYIGTFAPSGTQLDITSESWAGRSKIHVTAADSSHILAYSFFNIFTDSETKPKVTFDSVKTSKQFIDPCTLSLLTPITIPGTATITPPAGCGIKTISQFMHDIIPQLSVIPNPTSGDISITSTSDLGECSIIIYDILGNQKGMNMMTISQNVPAKLSLPAGSGVYNVRVQSGDKTWDLRAMVSK